MKCHHLQCPKAHHPCDDKDCKFRIRYEGKTCVMGAKKPNEYTTENWIEAALESLDELPDDLKTQNDHISCAIAWLRNAIANAAR